MAPPALAHPERLATTRAAVLRAASDLLIEGGASLVTIERVVERSGVARSTIYRHWRSQSALVLDAFRALLESSDIRLQEASTASGDIREVLGFLTGALEAGLAYTRWAPVIPSLIELAERDPEMRNLIDGFLSRVAAIGRDAVHRAIEEGELPPSADVDLLIELLIAPIFYRRFFSGRPVEPGYAGRLVDSVLRSAQ